MNIISIEWDGDQPPTTWYNRLRKYGLHVRGDKNVSPLERRRTSDGSVVVQEATILCASDSLAAELSILAKTCGAKIVRRSQDVEINDFVATIGDIEIHERIEALFSKKGRPAGDKQDFTVLCLEEMKAYTIKDAYYAAVCPNCKGLKIKTWVGEPHGYINPNTGNTTEDWVRMRFATGVFYIGDDGVDQPPSIGDIKIDHVEERKIVGFIQKSEGLQKQLAKLPPMTAFRIMDAIVAARVYGTYENRREARVKACVYLLQHGINSSEISLAEDDFAVDLLDAADIIKPDLCGSIWLSAR